MSLCTNNTGWLQAILTQLENDNYNRQQLLSYQNHNAEGDKIVTCLYSRCQLQSINFHVPTTHADVLLLIVFLGHTLRLYSSVM